MDEVRGSAAVLLGILGVVGLVFLGVVLVGQEGRERTTSRSDGLTPAGVPRGTPVSTAAPLPDGADTSIWARDAAARTSIPARALEAYAAAELAQRARTPDCRLSWATLAGIGRVESNHARINGSRLDGQGVSSPPIVGIPLDGSNNTREIADTDGGRLDGDTTYDRAVGPLQFLPTTWARFGGGGDPQRIDDAARAAAAYLCAEGRDTASGDGWWDGVLAYNRSVEYARLVWAAVDRYAGAAA
ncbi:MAG: lytic murein transglycosylase [Pseudonocardia sp.]|nr:lytic murein transglycosylase [Pseudonocardia sp.]